MKPIKIRERGISVCGVTLTKQDVRRIRLDRRTYIEIANDYEITVRAVRDLKDGNYPNQAWLEGREK